MRLTLNSAGMETLSMKSIIFFAGLLATCLTSDPLLNPVILVIVPWISSERNKFVIDADEQKLFDRVIYIVEKGEDVVPGDGGSQFEAKLHKPKVVASYCSKDTSDYYYLWLNLEQLVPYLIDCFVDNMRLVYDNVNHTTHNSPGVDIRIPGFGNTSTVEWLDHSELSITDYYHTIVSNLVKWGYTKNKNIRGAPYDFRKAPNEMGQYFKDLESLIEETYYSNNNTKVVIMAHSMGNPVILYFLNRKAQEWKDKFIKSMISLAGVWGGAMKPVRLMISGDNLNVPIISAINVRPQQRSMPSTAWLMPSDEFWNDNEVLVVSPTRNYTVKDYKALFHDIDFQTGYMMWEDTNKLIKPLRAPGVQLFCLHGIGVDTPGQLIYTNDTWRKKPPLTLNDLGDGTVNLRSLKGCLKFKGQQSQPVKHIEIKGAEHLKILNLSVVMKYLKQILVP